jgi:signal peptidase II
MPSFFRLFILISLPLFILDYVTKELTVRNFAEPTDYFVDHRTVIENFFDLVRVHNRGVAFGMGNEGPYANYVFGTISLAALGLIGWMWKKGGFPTKLSQVAVALLVSGVMGNLLDRFTRGYVVDFLHFNLGFMTWPAFNVADSCICIAAAFLFFSAFQKEPTAAPTA